MSTVYVNIRRKSDTLPNDVSYTASDFNTDRSKLIDLLLAPNTAPIPPAIEDSSLAK